MSGRAFSYFADTPGLPLSLKCMSNGRALYNFGRAEVAVDDGGYLILNDRQPYSIEIASPTRVETFVLVVSATAGRRKYSSSFNKTCGNFARRVA